MMSRIIDGGVSNGQGKKRMTDRDRDREKSMKIRIIGVTLGALLFALCDSASAQQSKKVPRIGYIISAPLSASANRIEPFRQGLRELGYAEGKSIVIEYRYADGNRDRQRALASASQGGRHRGL
jgi:hypothetical protein